MKTISLLSLGLLLIATHVAFSATLPTLGVAPMQIPHMLWPIPAQYTVGTQNITINDPCNFSFNVQTPNQIPQIPELITLYKGYMFPATVCATLPNATTTDTADGNSILNVNIEDATQFLMNYGVNESYSLTIEDGSFTLNASTYLGFVRGIETFSQLLSYTTSGNTVTVGIPFTPVTIADEPRFPHRGVMVDTSRHFISKDMLFQVMDAMVSVKLNVFHWHITDSDSFPMYMPSHPNMNLYGAFSAEETYSQQDVRDIVNYAILRGIKITPEMDSPSHTGSWGNDPEFADLLYCATSIWYEGIPFGQLDPTLDATYNLVADLIKDIETYFPWDTIHLGADEVFDQCWEVASVESFMKTNNIANYNDLFNYYVSRQSKLVSPQKTRVYWTNPATSFLQFQNNDVLQWWGTTSELTSSFPANPTNKYILSNSDYFYLDCGMGNYFGNPSWCDPFHTWADMYKFEPSSLLSSTQLASVLGMEVAMWGELDNDSVIINKIFPRTLSMAEKAWSPAQNQYDTTYSVFVRLNNWITRIQSRDIECQPISAGYCEKHPEMCFA
jgi:hexosaminidase